MDPENHDPLNPQSPCTGSDSPQKSGNAAPDPHASHHHDRDPHWEELGRGTTQIPKGAAEILKSYFNSQQVDKAGQYHSFFSSWRELAGLDLSAHSTPRDIRNHTLIVDADHPGWVQMIYLKKKSILRKIRHTFPQLDITDLRVLYHPETPADSPGSSCLPELSTGPEKSTLPQPSAESSRHIGSTSVSSAKKEPSSKKSSADSQKLKAERNRLEEALKKLGKHIEGDNEKS